MDGVILFVDDKVHHCYREGDKYKRSPENALFEALRQDFPVLGIHNLSLAEQAIKSIGSFSVIILDWVFDEKEALGPDDDEAIKYVRGPEDRTLRFLEDNEFYSLVYVYSTEDVEAQFGPRLRKRFGERIRFQKKPLSHPAKDIVDAIKEWRERNQNLSIPLAWTSTINLAIQKIFKELSEADENWIRQLGNSADLDGISGDVFVIEILQFLLTESLVQNHGLLTSIRDYLSSEPQKIADKDESVAKLFRRLIYTKLNDDAPIMTGDICELGENRFGVVVTPECDIKDVRGGKIPSFELLTFFRDDFTDFLKRQKSYERAAFANAKAERLEKLGKMFNQEDGKFHILPSFPMDEGSFNMSAVIDFSKGSERFPLEQVSGTRKYKLNSPFIQQLRQRYFAYLGRVGVPSLPSNLRNFNLK